VTDSVTFSRAGQLRRLLRWLGERSLASGSVAPSEKEIAESVLNRKDFDPQADSLVRKEMSRLREKLSRYYLSEGLHDEMRIAADNGYSLRFRSHEQGRTGAGKSCWLVLPFRTNPELKEIGEELHEGILMGVAGSGRAEVVAPTTALAYFGKTGDVRQFAADCMADMVLEGRLQRLGDALETSVWIVDGRTGRATRSGRITAADVPDLARSTAAWVLQEHVADNESVSDTPEL
jgi:TolB-like protein